MRWILPPYIYGRPSPPLNKLERLHLNYSILNASPIQISPESRNFMAHFDAAYFSAVSRRLYN